MAETGLLHHPWITRWKIDVEEYHRMAEAGFLTEDDRVELIEGEIIRMSPIGIGHTAAVIALSQLLFAAVVGRAYVSVQNPVRLDDGNEPQPDFALLRPKPNRYRDGLPGRNDILLLVEVADSSLRYDREVKLPLYARYGIPEVWIVDLSAGVAEVHRQPTPAGYAECRRAGRGETLEPLPGAVLRVDDILG